MQPPETFPEDPRIPQFFQDMMLEIPDAASSICSHILAAINEHELD